MNRLQREDKRPTKYAMALYLRQRGWKRQSRNPWDHEPTMWIDPLECVPPLRYEAAWELQQTRDRAVVKLTKLQRDMLIRSIDGTATAWTTESAEVLAGLESIGLIEPSRQWRHCWRITDLGRAALQSADKKEDSK